MLRNVSNIQPSQTRSYIFLHSVCLASHTEDPTLMFSQKKQSLYPSPGRLVHAGQSQPINCVSTKPGLRAHLVWCATAGMLHPL